MTDNHTRLLTQIVAWPGDYTTEDHAREADLDPAWATRRGVYDLRTAGLVEPAAYRLAPWADPEDQGDELAREICTVLEDGPLQRVHIPHAVNRLRELEGLRPVELSGHFKRTLGLLVATGQIIPAAHPWPTEKGIREVLSMWAGAAEVVAAAHQTRIWREAERAKMPPRAQRGEGAPCVTPTVRAERPVHFNTYRPPTGLEMARPRRAGRQA